jgi:hypothetical protein
MTRRAALTSVSFPAADGEAIAGEGNPLTRSVFWIPFPRCARRGWHRAVLFRYKGTSLPPCDSEWRQLPHLVMKKAAISAVLSLDGHRP